MKWDEIGNGRAFFDLFSIKKVLKNSIFGIKVFDFCPLCVKKNAFFSGGRGLTFVLINVKFLPILRSRVGQGKVNGRLMEG